MLSDLFNENEESGCKGEELDSSRGLNVPVAPRSPCGFAGISNQGATCYLNSLIQTLLLTSEFRESLFKISEDELGFLEDKEKPCSKVRVIPIQLQRLFARLLLLNQQSVSTVELTESFGWTNNEQLEQHDVQELNRILFSAIEDSLIGTTGQRLIKQLYHGIVVNQITCMSCNQISEREEDFMDLTLAVSGNNGLENGLQKTYCDVEILDGSNQYNCSRCKRLVDAKKGAKIRCLPPILTVSLLRFSFDYVKLKRFKETDKFVFPFEIDFAPYLEKTHSQDMTVYELFSVVIHRGGCYGGHYHAYIRDTDCLGSWTKPEETAIRIPTDPSTGQIDFIEVDSPLALLQAILSRNTDGLTVDKLCAEISKQTGVSWNKRFKKQYGPIAKFLKKYNDKFDFNSTVNFVSLKSFDIIDQSMNAYGALQISASENDSNIRDMLNLDDDRSGKDEVTDRTVKCDSSIQKSNDENNSRETCRKTRPPSPLPEDGHCWFNFDDSRVQPIKEKDIEKQFSGSESAYMLFYKRKSLKMPANAKSNPSYAVPDRLINLISKEQEELQKQRKEYEIAVNRITIQVHFSNGYEFKDGALKCVSNSLSFMEIVIDRRKVVTELKEAILELGGNIPRSFCLHRMKEVASGFHLYEEILECPVSSLKDLNIGNSTKLFVWDGKTVQCQSVPIGAELEPILLTVIYGNPHSISSGFAKCLTLSKLKTTVCDTLNIPFSEIIMKRLVGKDEVVLLPFLKEDHDKTLEELELKDGDQIFLENEQDLKSAAEAVLTKSNKLKLFVENRCQEYGQDLKWQKSYLDVDMDTTIAELKILALSKFDLSYVEEGGRLRIEDQTMGLRPPLHEEQTVYELQLTAKSIVILEPGRAPESNQITVTFTPGDPSSDLSDMEIIVDRNLTVGDCLSLMIEKAQFSDTEWHLRKTNWCGEAADILDDADTTLYQCNINDGEHLLLEKGTLPPKGFLRLPLWLYSSSSCSQLENTGMLACVTAGIQGLMGISEKDKREDSSPISLGSVEVSRESTLEELKFLIMTLPRIEELPVPTQNYLRLRLIEHNRLTRVLKGPTQTLQTGRWRIRRHMGRTKNHIGRSGAESNMVFIESHMMPYPPPPRPPWSYHVGDGFTRGRRWSTQREPPSSNKYLPASKHHFPTQCTAQAGLERLRTCAPRRLKLTSNSCIAVQILQHEENLKANEILLNIRQRIIDDRSYSPIEEVIFDTSKGHMPSHLKQFIADLLALPIEHVVIAKHFPQKYEWLVIENAANKKEHQKNKKAKQPKINLKNAPFHLQDGDTIGVKNLQYDAQNIDDFCTEEDEKGKEQLRLDEEEKRKQRQERKKLQLEFGLSPKQRKEVGLSIKVDNFT